MKLYKHNLNFYSSFKALILNYLRFLVAPPRQSVDFANTADYLFRHELHSIKKHIHAETISLAIFIFIMMAFLLFALKFSFGISVLMSVSGAIAIFYFILMVFKLWIVAESISASFIDFTAEEIKNIKDKDLPVYTILIPLYQEEVVIGQIIKAMSAIDYPKNKLDIIITLEEYDLPTINAIKEANPPKYFKTLILPDVQPKTKPKALNVAFLRAKGEFLVIYDAEIIPDANQLKKAFLAFKKYPEIGYLQTRLDHYNAEQNIITRLFNAEFSFYYDLFLPGLEKLGFPVPLSGHSTHFRKSALDKIGAWDPYNVAEDCDAGIRLYGAGYKTGILDSFSGEEATSNLTSWIKQRTRWMKGFMQTSIVHLRHPYHFKNEVGGWRNFFAFLLIVPGTVLINFLNLFNWIILLLWVITHSEIIKSFFPAQILYISVFSFILGNLVFIYLNILGVFGRQKYSLVKYMILSPLYWILLAIATVRAVAQIITKPHYWEKTKHEGDLNKGVK